MQPRELVRQWVDAFNRADVKALTAFHAEDAINHQVAEAPVQGHPAIRYLFEAGVRLRHDGVPRGAHL